LDGTLTASEDDIRQIAGTLQYIQSSQSAQLSQFARANQTSMTVPAVLITQSAQAIQAAQSAQNVLTEHHIQQISVEINRLRRRVSDLEEIIVTLAETVSRSRRFKRSRV
jgi:hypothetical protein